MSAPRLVFVLSFSAPTRFFPYLSVGVVVYMRLPVSRSISCKKADGQPPSLLQKQIMKPQWLKDAPHTLWHLGYPAHGYSRSPKKLCTQKSRQQERQFKTLARRGYDFLNMPPERLNIAWQQDSDEDVRPGANCDGPQSVCRPRKNFCESAAAATAVTRGAGGVASTRRHEVNTNDVHIQGQ